MVNKPTFSPEQCQNILELSLYIVGCRIAINLLRWRLIIGGTLVARSINECICVNRCLDME